MSDDDFKANMARCDKMLADVASMRAEVADMTKRADEMLMESAQMKGRVAVLKLFKITKEELIDKRKTRDKVYQLLGEDAAEMVQDFLLGDTIPNRSHRKNMQFLCNSIHEIYDQAGCHSCEWSYCDTDIYPGDEYIIIPDLYWGYKGRPELDITYTYCVPCYRNRVTTRYYGPVNVLREGDAIKMYHNVLLREMRGKY